MVFQIITLLQKLSFRWLHILLQDVLVESTMLPPCLTVGVLYLKCYVRFYVRFNGMKTF